MRQARTLPAPRLKTRTRFSVKQDETNESVEETAVAAALWTTAVEVIRGATQVLQAEAEDDDDDDDEDSTNLREPTIPYEREEEEDVYAAGMRNLLLSLDRNFESEVTEKHSNVRNSSKTPQDPVVTVLQKSLSLAKSQKKKKKYVRVSMASNDFHTRLPDIDEDRSLHVAPSLDDEYPSPLIDTSMSSSSSIEPPSPTKQPKADEEPWRKQVRVQSQLPNVEVLLLRRASSLSRAGSLRSTHSLTPSLRSSCSTLDESSYYDYDDEDEDGFSAFTRLRSYSSLQTSVSNISYAFQEVEEEDDILADCHTFSWFGAK